MDNPARLADDLNVLFALHAARLLALGARTRAFHHDLAAPALAGGWSQLWLLELGELPGDVVNG